MKLTKSQLKQIIKEEMGEEVLEVTKRSKPVKIDQSKNGVKVIVTRYPDRGSVVETDCECFGIEGRTHSNQFCTLLRKHHNETNKITTKADY